MRRILIGVVLTVPYVFAWLFAAYVAYAVLQAMTAAQIAIVTTFGILIYAGIHDLA
jgi:hypothetical protein